MSDKYIIMDGTRVFPTWQALVDHKQARIEALEAENAKLREALREAEAFLTAAIKTCKCL